MASPKKHSASGKSDHIAQEIGKRILAARNGLGWSQQALHSKTKLFDPEGTGISRAVLSLYETGVNKPGAREVILLCKALTVSPNWLLMGSESASEAVQPSVAFLQGDPLEISFRMAFAFIALAPEERDSLGSLIFSLLKKQFKDTGLSSLMVSANMFRMELFKHMVDMLGAEAEGLSNSEIYEKFASTAAESYYSNFGTLRPTLSEDEIDEFDPDNPPPPRKLQ